MIRVLPPMFAAYALVLGASHAAADPAAEQLFRDGRDLLKAGKLDQACDKFQQSREIEAKVGTLLNLADCREKQGKLATAWEVFLEAKALAAQQKDPRGKEAEQRAGAIAGKRAFLAVSVAPDARVPGLVVSRGGTEVPSAAWDTELPIDPGSYTLDVKAEGYEATSVKVDVAPQAHAKATIPKLVKLAVVQPPDPPRKPNVPGNELPPIGTGDRAEVPPPAGMPPIRRFAIGLAFGGEKEFRSDYATSADATPALRFIAQTPTPGGALRGLFQFQYTRAGNVAGDNSDSSHVLAFQLGIDYLVTWKKKLASSFGGGFGLEFENGGYLSGTENHQWFAPRLSPLIVRLASPAVEIGLHAHFQVRNNPVLDVLVGLDWFIK